MHDAFRPALPWLVALASLGPSGTVQGAGSVHVTVRPVPDLIDAGRDAREAERNVEILSKHLASLAGRLPDGQALKVELTDVDLAGQMHPTRRWGEVRVATGRADWPSLTLRWSLSAGGRTLAQGEDRVADMAYLQHPLRGRADQPLAYELRLIDRWFAETVLASTAR